MLRHSGTGPPIADLGNLMLVPTTGRTATQLAADYGRPVVVVDLALDPAAAGRFAIAGAHGCPQAALESAVGLLQACGDAVGARWVVTLLDALAGFYGDGRHRACPKLRQVALTGERLHES